MGVIYDEFGPLPIRIKKSHLCFEDFKMILLLQNLANLKISPCSLNGVCKILEFWSSSWYFWSFKSFFIFSFWHSFAIIGFHIAILSANTNLKDTGYSFYRSGVSLENCSYLTFICLYPKRNCKAYLFIRCAWLYTQPAITCSKLTIETLKQDVNFENI